MSQHQVHYPIDSMSRGAAGFSPSIGAECHFCLSCDGQPETVKMREAPWSATAKLPPWISRQKELAGATALQG